MNLAEFRQELGIIDQPKRLINPDRGTYNYHSA